MIALPIPSIEPFHFRSAAKPLFGCYHEAFTGQRRNCAVLICPPVGHEYINCHRALRQLATMLAGEGVSVLRFDYYGCGDSSGCDEEGAVHQWLEDISAAATELRHRSRCQHICVVGLRLGGTLGMIAGAGQANFDTLVAWDPIVNGGGYLQELLKLQEAMASFRPGPKAGRKAAGSFEILGFPLTQRLCSELGEIDLLNIATAPAKTVLVIESGQREGASVDLEDRLGRFCIRLEHRCFDSPRIWLPTSNGSLLVPFRLLQSLVSWTCERHA